MRQFFVSLLELLEVGLVAFGAVFLIKTYLVQPFLVSGSSMLPNFSDGDYLLIDELTYHFREPKRGEVIVFRYPNDESTFFIKRIIGLPGEEVEVRNDKVIVYNADHSDGFALDESYLPASDITTGNLKVKVPAGSYFVLGDNRRYSFDSRNWGTLKKSKIVGSVDVRLWPPDDFRVFAAPKY